MFAAIKKHISLKISIAITLVLLGLTLGIAIYIIHDQVLMMEGLTLDKAKLASALGANMYGTILEEAIDNGMITVNDAFDQDYKLIKGFNWGDKPKYHTKYDFLTDKAMQVFQDKFLETKDFVFAVGVDTNGYLPTHNSKYQRPVTNDINDDLEGNRTKRIFDDPVGKAAARNVEAGFKQEYRRDTGEIMWDVSSPIYVKGQHWGGFRIGVSIDRIEKKKSTLMISLIILFSIFSAVIIGTVYVLVKRATNPIVELSAMADKISMGEDLDVKIVPKSVDEIGVLTKSIDRLRVSMKAAMDRLGE